MEIINRIRNFFNAPFKTRFIRDFSSRFSFFNRDLATNETIFSAISLKSNVIASLPLFVQEDYKKVKPNDDSVAMLFKYGPNPRMTTFEFMKIMEVNRCTKGAAYAIKEYGYAGEVIGLWILNNDYVEPVLEKDSNELYYYISNFGDGKYIHNSNIIAVTYMTSDGYTPISPLDVLKNTIDYDREIKEFSLNQMQNGLKAHWVVKIQTKLGKENLDEYMEMMKNFQKNGVVYVDSGKEFQELKNTSYIDPNVAIVENITVERVERVYSMIGKLTKGSTSNSGTTDTEDLLYLKDAVLPTVRMYEQEFTKKLFNPYTNKEAKLNMSGFARATMEKRGIFYQQMIRSGIMTQNEIRMLEDLPPTENGDTLFLSRDMCPSDMIRDLIEKQNFKKN